MRKALEHITSEINVHIVICTNQRTDRNKSCGNNGSEVLFKYIKERMRAASTKHGKVVKVSATGCLSNCANGPVLVCYPAADWYKIRSKADADVLIAGFEREWLKERKMQKAAGKKEGFRRPLFKPETGIPPSMPLA